MGQGTHERYLKLAQALAARYGVSAPIAFDAAQGFHCGHKH